MSKLETHPEYKVIMHYRLSDLIHNYDGFSSEQIKYIKHPRTHVDFVVFDKISFKPILCIEVDGAKYHDYVKQKKHDETKKDIIETNNIPFLRLRTNESGEEEKLDKYL